MMGAWDGLTKRMETGHPPKAHELQTAEREFLHLYEQEPGTPWRLVQNMFYNRVGRELGYW